MNLEYECIGLGDLIIMVLLNYIFIKINNFLGNINSCIC